MNVKAWQTCPALAAEEKEVWGGGGGGGSLVSLILSTFTPVAT